MIKDFSLDDFVKTLHAHLSPTSPIQSIEHLFGRAKQLQLITQALHAPGRSIFVYGDRGVGKTSLAQTVAFSHQSTKRDPIFIACEPDSTFAEIMQSALRLLSGDKPTGATTTHSAKLGWRGVGLELMRTRKEEVIPQIQAAEWDLNSAITALLEVGASRTGENTVVVVDEFDRISSDKERGRFGDFVKQLGDKRVPVRFVFCGVADSMQKLLGSHGSAFRYILEVKLETLGWEARFDIIDGAASALGVTVDERPRWRIAAISDGFPYYVHRMCEQLFWQMFNDPLPCVTPTHEHYRQAVAESLVGIEEHLRSTYEKAVTRDTPDYEQVLWAVADHSDLTRSTESIYESYLGLFGGRQGDGEQLLDRSSVVARLNTLKGTSCGQILAPFKKGWYQFRENIMRGYVRLRAEEQGCELALDYSAASSSNASLGWPQRGARRRIGTTREGWDATRTPKG